jgi:hypothetical protein
MKFMNQLLQTIFQSRNSIVESISGEHAQADELAGNKELPSIFNQLFPLLNIRPNSPGQERHAH